MTVISRSRSAHNARPGPPIALQFVALIIGGLLASQLITVAIVLCVPPQPRPIYRLDDVAAAVARGVLKTSEGARLTRTAVPRMTAPPDRAFPDEVTRLHLATLMRIPAARVQVYRLRPADGERWIRPLSHIWDPGPPRHDDGPWRGLEDHPPRGFRHEPPMAGGAPPPLDERFFTTGDRGGAPFPFHRGARGRPGPGRWWIGDPNHVLWGRFIAAVQQPSGQWIVVQPAPESFPNEWQWRMLMWLGASVLLLAPAGYLFARRITAPLGDFAEAARRFGADPNSPPMLLEGPSELGVAARAFNDMQTRLKRYVADRTAMVGAISHDLRTPIARIRFKIERSPGALSASVANDLKQMEDMISAVLAFIRDGQGALSREPLDLMSVLECVVDEVVEVGGRALVVEAASATVEGDPVALKRLFSNLVTNAVKYAGSAHVSLKHDGNQAVVEVCDEGPGLCEHELERVFEPFYRTDRSRNLDSGGIGLGLAVARSIAREHGGDVTLETRQVGLTAIVRLPLARPTGVAAPGSPSPASSETRDRRGLPVPVQPLRSASA